MPRPEYATQDAVTWDHGRAWDRGEKMGLPNGSYTFEVTDMAGGQKPGGAYTVYAEFSVVGVGKGGDADLLGRVQTEYFTLSPEGEFTWGWFLRAVAEEGKVKALPKGSPVPFSVFVGKRFGGRVEGQKNPKDGKTYQRIMEYFPVGSIPTAVAATAEIEL